MPGRQKIEKGREQKACTVSKLKVAELLCTRSRYSLTSVSMLLWKALALKAPSGSTKYLIPSGAMTISSVRFR